MNRFAPHYGLRYPTSWVPLVYVTQGDVVVHKSYGVTPTHALNRALRWMREHGDPRT